MKTVIECLLISSIFYASYMALTIITSATFLSGYWFFGLFLSGLAGFLIARYGSFRVDMHEEEKDLKDNDFN